MAASPELFLEIGLPKKEGDRVLPKPPATGIVNSTRPLRFRLFVDFWNLQLTLNERESEATGVEGTKFDIDWQKLPACLVEKAAGVIKPDKYSYEGTIVFTSFNPKKDDGKKFKNWVTNWLDRQPGIQVQLYERQPKAPPKCSKCHRRIEICPHADCGVPMSSTVEKGVDTAIATDMIRLAWEGAYDVAVLATSDRDLVPAVEFLDSKGIRVVQAGFPPSGSYLAKDLLGEL